MQRTNRALSILLSIVMILSLFTIIPTSAGAAIVDPAATGDGTVTIYVINNNGWSDVKLHYWGSSSGNPDWNDGGIPMNSFSGNRIYTYDIPSDVTGILFRTSGHQTGDINGSNLTDGSIWKISSSDGVSAVPTYYLVGDVNNWQINDAYAFSLIENSNGIVEYKLSNVHLSKSDQTDTTGLKVLDSNNNWYPANESNYKVSADGTYDVYFRPDGDGNVDWYPYGSWRCLYCADVTPSYNVTWMNGNVELKVDSVREGTTPSYDGVIPTRPDTATSSTLDVFVGWEEEIVPATGNAVYHAKFETKDRFDGQSISLNGDIAINYYIHLTDEELAAGKTVTFDWTVKGKDNHVEYTILATDRQKDGRYKVSCPVAVAEMNYPVTASTELCGETVTNIYSVKQYADIILSQEYGDSYVAPSENKTYANLSALVTKMLDYGAMAQLKFNRTDYDLANDKDEEYSPANIPATDEIAPQAPDLSQYGLTYSGSTVVFLSQTSLRHYFTCDNVAVLDNLSISFGENTNVAYKTKGGEIYFELSDIPAAKLSTRFSLEFGGNQKYDYSVIDYARACVNSDTMADNMKKLAKATYWYSAAADAYFA